MDFFLMKGFSKSDAGISLPNLRIKLTVNAILESFGYLKLKSAMDDVLINLVLRVSIN